MRIDTYSAPFSLCCLWEDARCGRDLCQVSCGNPCSGWPCWMLLCRSRKPYAAVPASTRSPCTPQRGLRLQLPTSCACGSPRCAGTSWPVCGLLSGWYMRVFRKGYKWGIMIEALLVEFTLIEDSLINNVWDLTYHLCWCLFVWAESRPCLSVVWCQSVVPSCVQGCVCPVHHGLLCLSRLSDTAASFYLQWGAERERKLMKIKTWLSMPEQVCGSHTVDLDRHWSVMWMYKKESASKNKIEINQKKSDSLLHIVSNLC